MKSAFLHGKIALSLSLFFKQKKMVEHFRFNLRKLK